EGLARSQHAAYRNVPVRRIDVLGGRSQMDEQLAAAVEDQHIHATMREPALADLTARHRRNGPSLVVDHVDQLVVGVSAHRLVLPLRAAVTAGVTGKDGGM